MNYLYITKVRRTIKVGDLHGPVILLWVLCFTIVNSGVHTYHMNHIFLKILGMYDILIIKQTQNLFTSGFCIVIDVFQVAKKNITSIWNICPTIYAKEQ